MQLTRASEYGLRGMLYLAKRQTQGMLRQAQHDKGQAQHDSLAEIAEAEKISRKFLSRLFKILAEKGFVEVKRGKHGGYRLAKAPREISMLEIIEALEGPIAINQCLQNPSCCSQSAGCPMMSVWGKAQGKFVEELKNTSLEKLVEGK